MEKPMGLLSRETKREKIELDTQNLTPQQIRLIKHLNYALKATLTTEYEDEYFELSAEFMKTCAALIKSAHFAAEYEEYYSDQALEYAADIMEENISKKRSIPYDN